MPFAKPRHSHREPSRRRGYRPSERVAIEGRRTSSSESFRDQLSRTEEGVRWSRREPIVVLQQVVVFVGVSQGSESPLYDLTERWVDVDRFLHGAGVLVSGVHQVDDLLDQDGCIGTDYVATQYLRILFLDY